MGTATAMKPLAVVTGASSGIGFELARQFATNGFDVVIVADEQRKLAHAARELQTGGVSIELIAADLTKWDDVERVAAAVAERPVDALALNAGVGVGGDFRETDLRRELDMIELNCTSTVHLAKRVIPGMAQRGKGRVLITSSVAGTMPAPYEAVYGATKAFVLSLAEALAYELKDTGVTVTAIQPGPTDTPFFARANLENTKVGRDEKDDPAEVARQAFDAMMAGKAKAFVGSLKSKAIGVSNEVLPEQTKAAQHARLSKPTDK